MFDLANILEFIVDGFNNGTFSKKDFVTYGHQGVLYVVPDLGNQVYTVHEKCLHEFSANISLVGKQFAVYLVQEVLVLQRFPVIHIGLCNGEVQYLPFVVDNDMQFEAMEPSHGGLPSCGNALEDPVAGNAIVFAHPDRRGAHKGPVHSPAQQVFRNRAMGIRFRRISSVNLLKEIVLGKSFCICFLT